MIFLVVIGAGTVGFWVVKTFARAAVGRRIVRMTIVDRARIRPENGVTCPEYQGHAGRPKVERLGELAGAWFARRNLQIRPIVSDVEALDWSDVIDSSAGGVDETVIGVVGLDAWSSRIRACEDLRVISSAPGGRGIPLIQIGLDKDQAAVAVFGWSWGDPCPACGLRVLPESTPCCLRSADGELVRGNLHGEAQAGARLAARITRLILRGDRRWINTKTNLFRQKSRRLPALLAGGRFRRFTRRTLQVKDCWGPHGPATPLRWEGVLEDLTEGGPSHDRWT